MTPYMLPLAILLLIAMFLVGSLAVMEKLPVWALGFPIAAFVGLGVYAVVRRSKDE